MCEPILYTIGKLKKEDKYHIFQSVCSRDTIQSSSPNLSLCDKIGRNEIFGWETLNGTLCLTPGEVLIKALIIGEKKICKKCMKKVK